MGGKNDHAELGEEGETTKPFPSRVPNLPPVVEVSVGWFHVVARTEEGEVYSWGRNDSGETGQGLDKFSVTRPTLLPFPEKITKVLCGAYTPSSSGKRGPTGPVGGTSSGTRGWVQERGRSHHR
jgi:alpha-tubulin suppressor-like RCC1 family protein